MCLIPSMQTRETCLVFINNINEQCLVLSRSLWTIYEKIEYMKMLSRVQMN